MRWASSVGAPVDRDAVVPRTSAWRPAPRGCASVSPLAPAGPGDHVQTGVHSFRGPDRSSRESTVWGQPAGRVIKVDETAAVSGQIALVAWTGAVRSG